MAGIPRTTQVIFSTTGLTPTGGFAAAANGTTTTEAGNSNTPANIMTGQSGEWAAGWLAAVLGASKFPAVEDMNGVFNVVTSQLAYILERGIPEYDAGTSYNTNDIVRGVGLTTLYASVGNANIGNAVSNATYWTFLCDLASLTANVFTGGTTTGSANAQVLASTVPAAGLVPNNGQTVIFTAGFTNTGNATLAVTAPSISATAIKKDSGSGLVNLVAGDITAGDTIYVSWNSTSNCWVLTSGLALGTAAYKSASDNTKSSVSSIAGATVVGHVMVANDTAGTVADGGAPNIYQSATLNPTLTTSTTGVMMGLAGAITPAFSGVVEVTIVGGGTTTVNQAATSAKIHYGTGTAPSNGASPAGTAVGNFVITNANANITLPFTTTAIISGLSVGTAYWFDLDALTSTGNFTLSNITVTVKELR